MDKNKYHRIRRSLHWGVITLLVGILSYMWRTDSNIDPFRHKISGALIVVSILALIMTEFNKWWERRNGITPPYQDDSSTEDDTP